MPQHYHLLDTRKGYVAITTYGRVALILRTNRVLYRVLYIGYLLDTQIKIPYVGISDFSRSRIKLQHVPVSDI